MASACAGWRLFCCGCVTCMPPMSCPALHPACPLRLAEGKGRGREHGWQSAQGCHPTALKPDGSDRQQHKAPAPGLLTSRTFGEEVHAFAGPPDILGLSLTSACLPHELQPFVQTLVLRGSKMYIQHPVHDARSCTVSQRVSKGGAWGEKPFPAPIRCWRMRVVGVGRVACHLTRACTAANTPLAPEIPLHMGLHNKVCLGCVGVWVLRQLG